MQYFYEERHSRYILIKINDPAFKTRRERFYSPIDFEQKTLRYDGFQYPFEFVTLDEIKTMSKFTKMYYIRISVQASLPLQVSCYFYKLTPCSLSRILTNHDYINFISSVENKHQYLSRVDGSVLQDLVYHDEIYRILKNMSLDLPLITYFSSTLLMGPIPLFIKESKIDLLDHKYYREEYFQTMRDSPYQGEWLEYFSKQEHYDYFRITTEIDKYKYLLRQNVVDPEILQQEYGYIFAAALFLIDKNPEIAIQLFNKIKSYYRTPHELEQQAIIMAVSDAETL